jgi:hypothetical protein
MKRRGITLLEFLLTSMLLSIVLGVFASLVQGYGKVMRHVSGKDRTLEGIHSGLEAILAEVGSATQVLAPLSATAEPALDLTRIDRGNPARFPTAVPVTWEPLDPSFQLRVRYYQLGERLVREVTPSGGTTQMFPLADSLTDFRVSLPSPGLIEVSASFRQEKLIKSVTVRALRRVLQ